MEDEEDAEEAVRAAGKPAGGQKAATQKAAPQPEAQSQDDGGPRKSFFTKKLEYMFEERGVDFPPAIIRLLDTPFDDFTEEQTFLYKNDFKGRHLSVLLGDMLQELYEKFMER